MSEPTLEQSKRICSDADDLPTLDDILRCLRTTRRYNPATVTFTVNGSFVDTNVEDVTIQVAPTCLRTTIDDQYEYPEYEFEGWLIGDPPYKTWVRGSLNTNDTDEIVECTLFRLRPNEEYGRYPSPEVDSGIIVD